MVIIKLYKILV